jgi:clan AA aspartic protease (TIGR02281 family)
MKYLTIIYLMTLTLHCSAQVVKSKDGVSLGKRSEFISSCMKGFDKELLNINGVEIETDKYCACVCDNLIPTIDSWEMEKAVKENKMPDLFLKDKNFKILMKCLQGNFKIDEDYEFNNSNSPDIEIKIGIKNCIDEIMNDEENKEIWTEELAEEYCVCAIDKLYSSGYKYKDILEIEDENGESFNEIVMPCFVQVFKDKPEFQSSNFYKKDDIEGGGSLSLIPLVDYIGQGYKIKISISGVTKYYLFDTGASDLVIDGDTERELLLNGTLKRESYLGKMEYTLANNQRIQAQMVEVDNMTIGDYTLNNVVIAVINEGSLLCGKSFLDKFKNWELDEQNEVLILHK